jgi:hypothetical protein
MTAKKVTAEEIFVHSYASRLDYQRVQQALEKRAQSSKAEAEKALQELELFKSKAAQEVKEAQLQLQAAQEELARLKSTLR